MSARPTVGTGIYTYLGEDTFGAFEGITAARPRRLVHWESLKLNNVPAEVILLAAALAYVVSALAWCNYHQLWHDARRVAADIPQMFSGMEASAGAFISQTIKPKEATTDGDTSSANGSEVRSLLVECQRTVKSTSDKQGNAAAAVSGKSVVVRQRDEHTVHTALPPIITKPAAVASVSPPKQQTHLPVHHRRDVALTRAASHVVPPANSKSASSNVDKGETSESASPASSKLSSDQVKDLSDYNQMLADYFLRAQTHPESSSPSPPSYKEWLSGNKAPF